VECLEARTEDHLRGALVDGAMLRDARGAAGFGEVLLQVLQQIEPARETLLADAARQFDIGRHLRGVLDDERRVVHSKKTAADGGAPVPDADKARQIKILRSDLRGDDGAETGMLYTGQRNVPGVQLIGGALMLALLVGHRADDRYVLHHLGGLGPTI